MRPTDFWICRPATSHTWSYIFFFSLPFFLFKRHYWLVGIKQKVICLLIFLRLVNRQGRLQFRPPFEEVRARYFREMKRFISIPNQFKGVSAQGEKHIFSVMIDRNASGFLTIFSKAEDLFSRLQAIQHKFKVPEQQMVLALILLRTTLFIKCLPKKHMHNVKRSMRRGFICNIIITI